MKNIKLIICAALILIIAGIGSAIVSAEQSVCCEKTNSGLFCQDVPASECASGAKQVPTACKSTSYCKPGVCFDSSEGTCLDNTPQLVCNAKKGVWSEKPIAQCSLGCCQLGDQASFVTLTRCKKLSAMLGLKTNYKKEITDEVQCILSVQGLEKGACVYENSELQRVCQFITRADCNDIAGAAKKTGNKTAVAEIALEGLSKSPQKLTAVTFYPKKLCTAEELGAICGPTKKTMCIPGKEEVYFVDTCGNPANIYDASKINDKEYWANAKDKAESCNPNSGNPKSAGCGNCDYIRGTTCRDSIKAGVRANYGDFICADLNCKATGKKHGESWCVKADDSVGSRSYKHICANGEEIVEACEDFRNQVCVEDSIITSGGAFSQAACRVNRWQDCIQQGTQEDCENGDKRDCKWLGNLTVYDINGQKLFCAPLNAPGTTDYCGAANAECIVSFELDLFGGIKNVKNGECLNESIKEGGIIGRGSMKNYNPNHKWLESAKTLCKAMGDCGPKVNWKNVQGAQKDQTGFKAVVQNKGKDKK